LGQNKKGKFFAKKDETLDLQKCALLQSIKFKLPSFPSCPHFLREGVCVRETKRREREREKREERERKKIRMRVRERQRDKKRKKEKK
jgi:hypothetical protein